MDDGPRSGGRTPGAKKQPTSSAKKAPRPVRIRPVAKKIGEGDNNLRQRAKWFRQRTTSDENQG